MNAVDTNVLLYFVDMDELAKQQKAEQLLARLAGQSTVLLWKVAVEFVAGLKRREHLGKATSKDTLDHWNQAQTLLPLFLPASNLIPAAFDLMEPRTGTPCCWQIASKRASKRSTPKTSPTGPRTTP